MRMCGVLSAGPLASIAGERSGRSPRGQRNPDALSRDLLRRGFKFVGPTICYAFMQAVGRVNDHTIDCFRYREVT